MFLNSSKTCRLSEVQIFKSFFFNSLKRLEEATVMAWSKFEN